MSTTPEKDACLLFCIMVLAAAFCKETAPLLCVRVEKKQLLLLTQVTQNVANRKRDFSVS
jgi:hypothetical protein